MANTETKWETGDTFYFTESPLMSPLTEKQMSASYVIIEHAHGDYFSAIFEGSVINVSTRWIRKPGKHE